AEQAERDGLALVTGDAVARGLVTNLGAVAVYGHDVPAGRGEIDDRRKARAGVAELIADRRSLARRGDRITSESDNNGSGGRGGHGRRNLAAPLDRSKLDHECPPQPAKQLEIS